MNKVSFSEVPFLVKAAVFVSLLNAWVLFEEVVIVDSDNHLVRSSGNRSVRRLAT